MLCICTFYKELGVGRHLDQANAFAFTNGATELAGTGYEANAATDWFVARGSAAPGETFQLTFFLSDLGDSILASAASTPTSTS